MAHGAYGTGAEGWRERLAVFGVYCQRVLPTRGTQAADVLSIAQRLQQNLGMQRSRGRTPVFLPVEVVNGTTAEASMSAAQGDSAGNIAGGLVELVFPRGVTVRVGAQIDDLQLRTVLRAVIAETGGCGACPRR
jgi:hypothetical protein